MLLLIKSATYYTYVTFAQIKHKHKSIISFDPLRHIQLPLVAINTSLPIINKSRPYRSLNPFRWPTTFLLSMHDGTSYVIRCTEHQHTHIYTRIHLDSLHHFRYHLSLLRSESSLLCSVLFSADSALPLLHFCHTQQ